MSANGDGGKLAGGLEQVLDDDGSIQTLAVQGRRPTELAGGDFHVVGPKGHDDVFNRQVVVRQLVGVEPDPHGILRTEVFHLAHPRHPRQHLLEVGLGIVSQVIPIHAAVFRNQANDDQPVASGFTDFDSLALNHVRQVCHG